MNSWTVKLTEKAEAELRSLIRRNLLSKEDIRVIRAWMNEMELEGPEYIAKSRRWDDHPLQYEWFGFRSSAFSNSGRIIYKVREFEVIAEVHRVTPDHDYGKKD